MQCAALIYNPASGRGQAKKKRVSRLLEDLRRQGIEAEPFPTRHPGHATELSRRALEQNVDLVAVWGGDGTLNEVAAGMLGSPTPLGLLPGGSVNVFARATGIPLQLKKASRALRTATPRCIPVGMAGGRPFLFAAGVGLDAEVIRRLHPGFKKMAGKLAFWIRGFSLLASHSFSPFGVRIGEMEYEATSVIAGNLKYYGGRYVITPYAELDEPLLDVVLFQGRRGRDYLRYMVGVLGGFHLRFRDALHVKTDRLEIESNSSIFYQLDGELAGRSPVEICVRADAIRFLLPDVAQGKTSVDTK
jgi:YegS/Rv2252/BmrU family lipid kinase